MASDQETDKTIFDEQNTNTDNTQADQPNETKPDESDPVATLLSEIKREDGTQKYASIEDAIKALKSSQEFIKTLETDNAGLKDKLELYREKAEKNITMEEILNSLSEQEETKPNEQPSEKLDAQTLKTLFKDFLNEEKDTELKTKNLQTVDAAIRAKFIDQDKSVEFLKEKAKEIGVSPDYLKDVASHSPKAAIKLLGLDEVKEAVGTEDVPSSVSTERFKHPTNPNQKPVSPFSGGSAIEAWRRAKENALKQQ